MRRIQLLLPRISGSLPQIPDHHQGSVIQSLDQSHYHLQCWRHRRWDHRRIRLAIHGQTIGVSGNGASLCKPRTHLVLRILVCVCYTAVWIPLWILPNTFGGLSAGGFFVQSGVQGAWGVIPIYLGQSASAACTPAGAHNVLGEVAPPAFRASFAGLAYQLGQS